MLNTNSYSNEERIKNKKDLQEGGAVGEHRKYIDRINLCMNQIDGLYYMAARKLGIKDNTLILFYVLNDRKPHTQKEICEEWLIPRTTINTIVRENVKEGRIRLENAGHKKEKQIFLTEKGKLYADHILKSVYEAEEKAVERTLKEFSPELLTGLEAFTGYLKEEFQREILDKDVR